MQITRNILYLRYCPSTGSLNGAGLFRIPVDYKDSQTLDIRSYLDTGNLELYAMGLLSGTEKAEAEYMIAKYPEIKAEAARIEDLLENFSMSAAVEPHVSLRDTILQKINSQRPGNSLRSAKGAFIYLDGQYRA